MVSMLYSETWPHIELGGFSDVYNFPIVTEREESQYLLIYYEPNTMLSTLHGFSFNQPANQMKENPFMKLTTLRNRPSYHLLNNYYMPGPVLFDIHTSLNIYTNPMR